MLNFTRQERVVVYFLIITLGIGAILKLVRNRYSVDEIRPARFYSEEQEFKLIANQINSGVLTDSDSTLANGDTAPEMSVSGDSDVEKQQLRININTAGVSDLIELPGIGPAIAKRIRAYTEQNGPFKNKADIVLVKGIGEKLYSRIEGLVTTE